MKSITTQNSIKSLEKTFTMFGYPHTITSDNGTQFHAEEKKTTCINTTFDIE